MVKEEEEKRYFKNVCNAMSMMMEIAKGQSRNIFCLIFFSLPLE
jgi:hypothetical protein